MESNSRFLARAEIQLDILERIDEQTNIYPMDPFKFVIFQKPGIGTDGELVHVYNMVNFYPIRSFCTVLSLRCS